MVLEKTLESALDCKESQPVHPKDDQSQVFIGRTDAEAEKLQHFGHLMQSIDLLEKTLMLGGIGGRRRRGRQMAGWHHQLDGHEFECSPGAGDRQGGLACCDSWVHKVSDMTEQTS